MMQEVQLDGLVGPTHNYAGLAHGNVASAQHAGGVSNPRAAALQGIEKMRLVMQLGVPQMVLPPHPRPANAWLRALGLRDVADAAQRSPQLLPSAFSSSGMWAANAATVCASADAEDGLVHITPANLISTPHRALESAFASHVLKRLFPGDRFMHHPPLPAGPLLADEGAANHMRLELPEGGVHFFVYGREGAETTTTRFPARHARLASEAIARTHRLRQAYFIQQNPAVIDLGVFHNDVIAMSHENVLVHHEDAFVGDVPLLPGLACVRVTRDELSVEDAVRTYLFNSQLITSLHGVCVLAPQECAEHVGASKWLARNFPKVEYVNLRESMQNGGGPACLRLRVPLEEVERAAVHTGAVLTEALADALAAWVKRHYRDRLTAPDLADLALAEESRTALCELETLLELPGLYDGFF